jgi:hypothetical protein
MGKTSRGLFLWLSSGGVIFLSLEPYRGPLTLNLPGHENAFHDPQVGSIVRCTPKNIHFPQANLSIGISEANTWQAPPIQMLVPSPTFIRSQMVSVVSLVAQRRPQTGFIGLLPAVLDKAEKPGLQDEFYYRLLIQLQEACSTKQTEAILDALGDFLGLGTGLTPSGDDLITGFLLALNRWGPQLSHRIDTEFLNQEILKRAHHATSTLSTSLIECATLGQADERLILALDGLVTGVPQVESWVAALAGWGSSSGYDALVGMALCLMQ